MAPRRRPRLLPRVATCLAPSCIHFPVFGSSPLICFQFLEQASFPPHSGPLHLMVPLPQHSTFAYLTTTHCPGLNLGVTSRRKPSLVLRGVVPITPFTALWASAFPTLSLLLIIGCRFVRLVWGGSGSHLPLHSAATLLGTGMALPGSSVHFFWPNEWMGMVWAISALRAWR